MTAKRGALHASRNRLGRTGQPRLEPMPTRRCSIKVPNAKAPKIAVPFGRAVSQSVGHRPQAFRCPSGPQCSRTGIDAVPETPVNPMASAASAVKRRPRDARLATRRPAAARFCSLPVLDQTIVASGPRARTLRRHAGWGETALCLDRGTAPSPARKAGTLHTHPEQTRSALRFPSCACARAAEISPQL